MLYVPVTTQSSNQATLKARPGLKPASRLKSNEIIMHGTRTSHCTVNTFLNEAITPHVIIKLTAIYNIIVKVKKKITEGFETGHLKSIGSQSNKLPTRATALVG